MKNIFNNVPIGTTVYSHSCGRGKIVGIAPSNIIYPVDVEFSSTSKDRFTVDGRVYTHGEIDLSFVPWPAPPIGWNVPPLPDLKMNTPILVWDSKLPGIPRHFAGFTSNGKVQAWNKGLTSYTAPNPSYYTIWDNYEIIQENK